MVCSLPLREKRDYHAASQVVNHAGTISATSGECARLEQHFRWYLNRNAKFVFNYEQTHFTAIPGGRNRQTEKSFLERFQIAF